MELILLGVIAVIFLVIFFFLYLELSTRKRRLVQDIKFILRDLPYKVPAHKSEEQSKLHSISKFLKLELEEEDRSKNAEEDFLEQYRNMKDYGLRNAIYEEEAKSIIDEAKTLRKKITWLDGLSIGELEKIQATIEKYYDSELPKSDVDVKYALSRANSILDHFIPMSSPKENTGVPR
jgi:hypothetical protein